MVFGTRHLGFCPTTPGSNPAIKHNGRGTEIGGRERHRSNRDILSENSVQSRAAAPWCRKEPMRLFWHLIRMPLERLPLEVFQARPSGRRPRDRPRTCWRDYLLYTTWLNSTEKHCWREGGLEHTATECGLCGWGIVLMRSQEF